jgi:hypothetical protein
METVRDYKGVTPKNLSGTLTTFSRYLQTRGLADDVVEQDLFYLLVLIRLSVPRQRTLVKETLMV